MGAQSRELKLGGGAVDAVVPDCTHEGPTLSFYYIYFV